MTNKPMLSVERGLLELVVGTESDNPSAVWKELRALLDKPAAEERGASHGFEQSPNTCRHDERAGVWWREGSIARTGRECCACGSVEEDPVKAAAQHQGEPLAWSIQWGSVIPGCRGHREVVLKDPGVLDAVITPLYAEQPAPVAVLMPNDWEDQLMLEMSTRFDLNKHEDDHMVYDDTQIGVEFARDWIKARLNGAKP